MRVSKITFSTTILQNGKDTDILVPNDVVEKLGAGKRPAILVTLNGYTYRYRIATMNGMFTISVSAEVREKASVKGGDQVEVDVELDTDPREIALPDDLLDQLESNPAAKKFYDTLAYSVKQRYVLPITSARTEETRKRRIEKAVRDLEDGKK